MYGRGFVDEEERLGMGTPPDSAKRVDNVGVIGLESSMIPKLSFK